jgi:hypothetical protein
MEPLALPGCRHDILGHYLKAIGLLRVLAKCANREHRDSEAEAWWDSRDACFYLRSAKYPTVDRLAEFFGHHYRPTPVFSPWNTGGGMDEKKEITFNINPKPWQDYWLENKLELIAHGFPNQNGVQAPELSDRGIAFDLKLPSSDLCSTSAISVALLTTGGKKPKKKIAISWGTAALHGFFAQLEEHRGIRKSDQVY